MADQVPDEDKSVLATAAKNCGMTWTTNHNKAAVCSLSVQPVMMA